MNNSTGIKTLWQPSEQFISESNMKAYEQWLAIHKDLHFDNYSELWAWSVSDVDSFWESLWEYFDIQHSGSYTQVTSSHEMPGVRWFNGTRLNYAEHIFRKKNDNSDAIIFQNEKERKHISWQLLENEVKKVQSYLIDRGIGEGDCVAGYLPNIPEAIYCFLAVNSLGAVWSCCSPDFGKETVIERLSLIEPKLLIGCDGYQYNGKPYNKTDTLTDIVNAIPSVTDTLYVPYLEKESIYNDATQWSDLDRYHIADHILEFNRVPFDHPIWVLYSSGTTGKPKAITHSHGGVLLEHLKYMSLQNDVKEKENFFWFTTTGWMMWNFLQASLLTGATTILFDGSPGYPDMNVLWTLAEYLPIHHFGTSAPYLTACMKGELEIGKEHDLKHLRSIGSTGSPLPPEVFEWIYDHIKKDIWLCSMSGGTDVCSAFIGSTPYSPVYKGLIQCRALGVALHAYNGDANKVIGSLGEMIIEKPMPSMPIYFWNDVGGVRYQQSYFQDYAGIWRHGDWIKIYDNGAIIIQGRSDATLNRKGVRIGTAEIYNVLEKIESLVDSLIISIELPDGGDIMPLFVKMQEGVSLDDDLIRKICSELKSQCSPRHVPDEIHAVCDIPYTLSGKKMEVPVKKIFLKMDINRSLNRDAIRNPEAIDEFITLAERLDY